MFDHFQAELTLPAPPERDLSSYLTDQGIKLAAGGVELLSDPFMDPLTQHPEQEQMSRVSGQPAAGAGDTATPASDMDLSPPDYEGFLQKQRRLAKMVIRRADQVQVAAAQEAASNAARVLPGSQYAAEAASAAENAEAALQVVVQYVGTAMSAGLQAAKEAQRSLTAPDMEACTTRFTAAMQAVERAEAAAADVYRFRAAAEQWAEAAACKASGRKLPFGAQGSAAVQLLLQHRLLAGTTPREVKRLLNRYQLAKCCLEAQVSNRQ